MDDQWRRRPLYYFDHYRDRYPLIHLKDFTTATTKSTALTLGSEQQAATELGRGQIDYRPILQAAKKIGIEYCFVDQDPPFHGMTPLEAAKVDYEYVRALL